MTADLRGEPFRYRPCSRSGRFIGQVAPAVRHGLLHVTMPCLVSARPNHSNGRRQAHVTRFACPVRSAARSRLRPWAMSEYRRCADAAGRTGCSAIRCAATSRRGRPSCRRIHHRPDIQHLPWSQSRSARLPTEGKTGDMGLPSPLSDWDELRQDRGIVNMQQTVRTAWSYLSMRSTPASEHGPYRNGCHLERSDAVIRGARDAELQVFALRISPAKSTRHANKPINLTILAASPTSLTAHSCRLTRLRSSDVIALGCTSPRW